MIIGARDNGRKVVVNVGSTLRLFLPANSSTGYMWDIAEINEKILRQVGKTEFHPESDLLGAPGRYILRFQALTLGQTRLKLIYYRPWEKGVKPLKSFCVQVVVH